MNKSGTGGTLAIISSVLGILLSLFFLALSNVDLGPDYSEEAKTLVAGLYIVIGAAGLALGALGIAGGTFALRRKIFGLALAGAIASSIIFYPLGIVAVILVSMGHQEFATRAGEIQEVNPGAGTAGGN
jgi:hypothetical protein